MGSGVSKAQQKRLGRDFLAAVSKNDYRKLIYDLYLNHSQGLDLRVWTSWVALQKKNYPSFNMQKLVANILNDETLPIYSWFLCKYYDIIGLSDIQNAYKLYRITKKSLIELAGHLKYNDNPYIEWLADVGVSSDAFRLKNISEEYTDFLNKKAENAAIKFDLAVILKKREDDPLMIPHDMIGKIYDLASENFEELDYNRLYDDHDFDYDYDYD